MSIMVCKKCGYQVDTDFHAEQMNDDGLCDACAPEEYDTIRNTKEFADWLANTNGIGEIIERAFLMDRALRCMVEYGSIEGEEWDKRWPAEKKLLETLNDQLSVIGIVAGFMKIAHDALEGTINARK